MIAELIPSHYDEKVRSRLIAGAEKALEKMNVAFAKESDCLRLDVFGKPVYLIPSHLTKFFQDFEAVYIFFNSDKNFEKTLNSILFKTRKNGFEMLNKILKILNESVSHISVEYDKTKIRLSSGLLIVIGKTDQYRARASAENFVFGRLDAILRLVENLSKLNRKEGK